jgi:hypothetical protein
MMVFSLESLVSAPPTESSVKISVVSKCSTDAQQSAREKSPYVPLLARYCLQAAFQEIPDDESIISAEFGRDGRVAGLFFVEATWAM